MWLHEQPQLDAAMYRKNDELREMAVALSEEVERKRAAIRSDEKPAPSLIGDAVWLSDTKPWYALATDPAVLQKVSARLAIPLGTLIRAVETKFRPPNWEVFFWMGSWLEQISTGHNQAHRAGMMLEVQSQLEMAEKARATQRAKAAAEALHSKEGGSRDVRAALRRDWATGKYATRALCAEEEYSAYGVSLHTAIKALQNTPDPDPWPTKKQAKTKKR